MNDWIQIIGFFAASGTTIAFIPQVIKTIKTKDTKAISLGMYVLFIFGLICWLIYGLLLNELPIILANAITLLLAGVIVSYKIKYK